MVVAYPARYGVSGGMSFLVNQDGVVYEQNLGKKTDGDCLQNDHLQFRRELDTGTPSHQRSFTVTSRLFFGLIEQRRSSKVRATTERGWRVQRLRLPP